MNYKRNAIRELQEKASILSEYSLGELIYASSRLAGVKELRDLLNTSDESLYSAINKVDEVEKEDRFINEEDFLQTIEKLYDRV